MRSGSRLFQQKLSPGLRPFYCFLALPMEVPLLPVNKVIKITDNFGLKFLFGEGSYGKVYHATMDDGNTSALKKLDVAPETEIFLSQISMVSRLKHENLIQLVDYYVAENLCVLDYEFATMRTLNDILHGAQPGKILDWIIMVKIADEAARGLNYLHGGIRSSNVLLFDEYQAKVAGFKLSNQAPDNAAHLHASRVVFL